MRPPYLQRGAGARRELVRIKERLVNALDLARWQFGVTTVYHFLFVPLTIGLAPLVAVMQTAWVRTGNPAWLRMTKFFGKLFLINFAMGVVTGIVQEFQFGMNWSEYSKFVGDIFGAPLAMEALIAFFLESTFLGLWIFGWDRLSKRVHLATIWLAAIGVNLSAFFIIAANSFMQHPVGTKFNPVTGRAELDSIVRVVTNSTAWWAFPHTVTASFVTAATFVAGIAGWWTVKAARSGDVELARVYRPALRLGLGVLLVSGIGVTVTGDGQAQLMFAQQPMKMTSAEALCDTQTGAEFSILTFGSFSSNNCDLTNVITVPKLTSFLSTHDVNATIKGVNDLKAEYVAKYGDDGQAGNSYVPNLAVTYWTFRLMIGFGVFSAALALAGLWWTRRGGLPAGRNADRFAALALIALPMPYLANIAGWVFTEMGRQPWIVAPNPTGDPTVRLTVDKAVSPFVDAPTVAISLIVFTLLYGTLAVVWYKLISREARQGAPQAGTDDHTATTDTPLTFAY
jgi:cytochrome bd ubiquinol oxidase subunit I